MNTKVIHVRSPATVANVGCAFDVLGFALEEPHDEIKASFANSPGVTIARISSNFGDLPISSQKNSAGVAALALLAEVNDKRGVSLEIVKGMPSGSGLGSSAASAAGAAFAVNELLGRPFTRAELVRFAMQGEKVACGTAHADNVAPALLGGFALIRDPASLDIISLSPPPDLFACVVCPRIELRTEDARKVLRQTVALGDAVLQFGNVAGLVAGLLKSDLALIGRSLVDRIVEPVRSSLIPGFNSVKDAALSAGALGCSISGSGPSVFAFSGSLDNANKIGSAMSGAFAERGIESLLYVSSINTQGAILIQQ